MQEGFLAAGSGLRVPSRPFEIGGGDREHYVIMMNNGAVIGLFQGMFDKNILTFNPGLSQDKQQLSEFTDVREIRERLLVLRQARLRDRRRLLRLPGRRSSIRRRFSRSLPCSCLLLLLPH